MASNRYVSTSFWDDPWVQSLEAKAKLLYLHLITNPLTNIAGIYEATDRRIAFDTSIDQKDVQKILKAFEEAGKVIRHKNWIIILNWAKHQRLTSNNNVKIGIDSILNALPDDVFSIVARVYHYPYLEEMNRYKELEDPYKTLTSPSQDPPTTLTCTSLIPNLTLTSTSSTEVACHSPSDLIVENWNQLGLAQIKKISSGTNRHGMLNARINEYGIDTVLQAIDKIKGSSFLRGQNKNGWIITIDWFLKPNNFIKVAEGNYDSTDKPKANNKLEERLSETMQTLERMKKKHDTL